MTDTRTRPMTPADYQDGDPVPVRAVDAHPIRDLVLAAVVGAAALWAVPKVLDRFAGGWLDDDGDELELDLDDELAAEEGEPA